MGIGSLDMREGSSTGSSVTAVPQVAQCLHLTETTVCKLARVGEAPGTKLGRTWRFKELIDEWLRQKADASTDPDPGAVRESD